MISHRVLVERATRDDLPEVLSMERELAELCHCPPSDFRLTEAHLEDRLQDAARSTIFVARLAEARVGFALCHVIPLGWSGSAGVYVEDIYVLPAFRSQLVGRSLMRAVAGLALGLARAAGDASAAYVRLDSAHDLDARSHSFFKRIGMAPDNINYRMGYDSLVAL